LIKTLGTALVAAVLATALAASAEARSHSHAALPIHPPLEAADLQSPTDESLTSADVSSGEFVISPAARRQLIALESDGNMPSADADAQMWGAGSKHSEQMNRFAQGIINRTSSIALSLTRSAMRFIGTPYVFGGTSPSGFDCSGYVQHVFAMLGIALPRTADAQYYAGHRAVGGLHMGDLVFFQTYLPGPSHVGIYLSDGKFISSSGHGVRVSRLSDSYWAARYIGAKRVLAVRTVVPR
jgi:cell wall-associated NlpC family hydrolase